MAQPICRFSDFEPNDEYGVIVTMPGIDGVPSPLTITSEIERVVSVGG